MGRIFRQDGTNQLPEELLTSLTIQDGTPLLAVTSKQPTLLVLLRHSGCLFCRRPWRRWRKSGQPSRLAG